MTRKVLSKILNVPYYSQLGDKADYYVNDCLAACLRSMYGYGLIYSGVTDIDDFTVKDFAKQILDSKYDLGSILDVYKLRNPLTLPLEPVSRILTLNYIRNEIDNNKPVICLTLAKHLLNRCKQELIGGHFITVTGYDEWNIYYHDPYSDNGYGKNRSEVNAQFELALNPGPNKYFSNPYQGLIYRP